MKLQIARPGRGRFACPAAPSDPKEIGREPALSPVGTGITGSVNAPYAYPGRAARRR